MVTSTKLDKFLNGNKFSKESGENKTHQRYKNDDIKLRGGVFTIKGQRKIDEFNDLYVKEVLENGHEAYLIERQLEDGTGPICVDIDLRFDSDVDERLFDRDFINELIEIYVSLLGQIFNFCKDIEFPIYVFQKPDVNIIESEGITKDGIHIIIGLQADFKVQQFLRDKIIYKVKNEDKIFDIFNNPECSSQSLLKNPFDDVFDNAISSGSNGWTMYGSKKPLHQAYQLTNIYKTSYQHEEGMDFDSLVEIEEVELSSFDVKKNFYKLSARYPNNPRLDIKESVNQEIMNIHSSKKTRTRTTKVKVSNTVIQVDSIDKIKNNADLQAYLNRFLENLQMQDYNLREIHEYTMALPAKYYESGSYNLWIRVGFALANTDKRLLITWIAFSAKMKSFDFSSISELIERWEGFDSDENNRDNLSYRSIIYWCKNDPESSKNFKVIKENSITTYLVESIKTRSDYDIAMVLFTLYKDNYVCISISNNIWYEFKNNQWREIDSATTLRGHLSEDLHGLYVKEIQVCVHKLSEITNDNPKADELRDKYEKMIDNAMKICDKIKDNSKKNNVMRECAHLFHNSEFIEKMDQNPYLLGFKNGVIDFKEKIFRDGQPEDYITKSTKLDYLKKEQIKDYDRKKAEIEKYMESLFPIKELRDYMWEHLASTLIGINHDQTFNIYTGSGSNGKSILVNLMEEILGDYKGTVPLQLITDKRSCIGKASPEIAQLVGIRYAVIQEPSKGDSINEGPLKEITGGDPLTGRALYKNTITFVPQFKLVVCTNTLLDVKSNDDGTWRRIRVCDFMSKFADDVNSPEFADYEYVFPKDRLLKEKMPAWRQVLMHMLVEKAFETGGLVNDCNIVKSKSDEYRISQDYISQFIAEKIDTSDPYGKITKKEISAAFSQWFTANNSNKPQPPPKELHSKCEKLFGKYNRFWKGCSIKEEDDTESFDIVE